MSVAACVATAKEQCTQWVFSRSTTPLIPAGCCMAPACPGGRPPAHSEHAAALRRCGDSWRAAPAVTQIAVVVLTVRRQPFASRLCKQLAANRGMQWVRWCAEQVCGG